MSATQIIKSFKGFDKDLKCRDFQYDIGKTFEHEGDVKACESGFHACEYPLDVFGYYPPAGSRFATVEQSGQISKEGSDSKVASKSITIKAEINFADTVKAAIEYTTTRCAPIDPASPASATGYQGAASATGYQGAASAIVLVFRDGDGDIIHIRASKVGENGIKADTFYTLDAQGAFEECE